MELTGKAKEDFKEWYLNHIKSYNDKLISNTDTNYFNLLTDSMKYGVFVDWFYESISYIDFVDIFIDFVANEIKYTPTLLEDIRTKAIEKANEIYNNQ